VEGASLPLIVAFLFFLLGVFLRDGLVSRLLRGLRAARAKGTRRTSYANDDNNRTSIRKKVNFRGYGCWLSSPSSSFFFFFLVIFFLLFFFCLLFSSFSLPLLREESSARRE